MLGLNCMKCSDLHRKSVFPSRTPPWSHGSDKWSGIIWNIRSGTEKSSFLTLPLSWDGSQVSEIFFARNCMKYPDRHRKVIFSQTFTPKGNPGLPQGRSSIKTTFFCWELKEISRSIQESHLSKTYSPMGMGWGVQFKTFVFASYWMKFPDMHRKVTSKLTSKVAEPSKTSWSPPRTKTQWSTKVVPSIGTSVGDLGCDDEYIGETSRTFGERYKEHLKAPSAIHHHSNQTGHTTNQNNFQIIGREGHNLARNIKESFYIRVNNPTINNNIGKFNLSHIWDRVLLHTKGLTLK